MPRKITLDLNSINVASFTTAPEHVQAKGAYLATKHTGDFCCQGTVCVTRIECSSNFCTG